ncbi:uncharacterized protein [Henckelia pumila]|uniref:uncharacterized protein isoform X1 n=1 Tax=Henckelia pumila TaxID=405737 RepID=UPI003C6E44AD
MAAVYSLYIINKSGGLIFYKDYGSAGRMDTNDSLRLASLWHSMHAISQQLSPVSGCSGIELLQADTFDLHCFQSLTDYGRFMVLEIAWSSKCSPTTSLASLKKRCWMNYGLFGILILVKIFLYSLTSVEMILVFDHFLFLNGYTSLLCRLRFHFCCLSYYAAIFQNYQYIQVHFIILVIEIDA